MEKDATSDADFLDAATFARPPRPLTARRQREQEEFQEWVREYSSQRGKDLREATAFPQDQVDASTARLVATPREYQIELYERAKEKNIIVVLPTGSGKTLIAVMLLRHVIEQQLGDKTIPKRVAFFIVDKVALCLQQYDVIRCNLEWPVAKYFGYMQPHMQDEAFWDNQFDAHSVVVCTAQILLDCLDNGFISMSQISLLVFDEAHHAKKNHSYARIMKFHYPRGRSGHRPRILGLTASPIDTQDNDYRAAAEDLEALLCSEIATISDEVIEAGWQQQQVTENIHYYAPLIDPTESSTKLLSEIHAFASTVPLLRRYITQTQDLSFSLGPWCADRFWQLLFSDGAVNTVSAKAGLNDGLSYDYTEAVKASQSVDSVRQVVSVHHFRRPTERRELLSSKVHALRDILARAFENSRDKRCIVFVDQRYTARLLADLFSQPEVKPCGLTAGYLVGLVNGSSIADMSHRKRVSTLESFRRGEINCLFATSVAEEGLDVPQCDQVIRFDLCLSCIQYVQSKGRARKSASVFTALLEEGNLRHIRTCMHVTSGAHAMRNFCASLPDDRKVAIYERAPQEETVTDSGGFLSLQNSKTVLAKFISTLSTGVDTKLQADYIVMTAGSKFLCTIVFPASAPIRAIDGRPENSKVQARSAAAYQACKTLIKMGYINANLQPVFRTRLPKMLNARLALSSKNGDQYEMILRPEAWSSLPGEIPPQLYATVISFKGSHPLEDILILTRGPLPDITAISLFVDATTKYEASMAPYGDALDFSTKEIEKLADFTLKLFDDLFSKNFDANANTLPYFLAPHLRDSSVATPVDWAYMDQQNPMPLTNTYQSSLFTDPFDGSRKFITFGVNTNLKPLEVTPDDVSRLKCRDPKAAQQTIADFSSSVPMKKRIGQTYDPEQNVYDAELLSLRRNFLERDIVDGDANFGQCHIISEPLRESTVPAKFARSALFLPSILHRLQSTLISLDACRKLDLELPPLLALEAFTKNGEDPDGLDPNDLFDEVGSSRNYERLEFLGDSFLKMATSIALYSAKPDCTESVFHIERMIMICNRNLFKTGLDSGLQSHVRSVTFDRRTWYPDLPLKRGKKPRTKAHHDLSDKSVADICEAVIGAAYVASRGANMDEAVKAVTKMVNNKNHTMATFQDYYAAFNQPEWHKTNALPIHYAAGERVCRAIGYSFIQPMLIRSALKHPSYPYEDIPSYQQLEFLGDALLETAAVDYLYFRFPNAGPQWLTEHKMVICSNQFLGFLCVQLGLHRGILTTHAHVPGQISNYERALKDAEEIEASAASESGREKSTSFWLSAPYPPKVLADVVEALIGAMFVDSKFDYSVVRQYFHTAIEPYFKEIDQYHDFGRSHTVTKASHTLTNKFHCVKWRFCVSLIPRSTENGIGALTESDCVCALLIHEKVLWHAVGASGQEAKVEVAKTALREMENMSLEGFTKRASCDCTDHASKEPEA